MNKTLEYILNKFNLSYNSKTRMPIEIPNYGRKQMAGLFNELGFRIGVEIGVEQGVYSEILCRANPQAKVYGIDPWQYYREYRDHTRQSKLDRFYEETKKRMAKYNYQIIKKFSMDAVKDFKDRSLDFVYIDGNHNFQHVTNDIAEWSRKLRDGGILAGHDYVRKEKHSHVHVFDVVNAYTKVYNIRPWFVLGTYAKIEGQIRDDTRSFMWVHDIKKMSERNFQ